MHSFYKEIVLDHFQRLRNRGELEGAHVEEHLNNPLCGDEVTVYAVFDGDKVSDVKFG
jgi:nitrogen fixation protein NifU and related proteins